MLCLGRTVGTSIEVDGPARFTILKSKDGYVRVGVEADRSVNIVRSELIPRDDEPDEFDLGGEARA